MVLYLSLFRISLLALPLCTVSSLMPGVTIFCRTVFCVLCIQNNNVTYLPLMDVHLYKMFITKCTERDSSLRWFFGLFSNVQCRNCKFLIVCYRTLSFFGFRLKKRMFVFFHYRMCSLRLEKLVFLKCHSQNALVRIRKIYAEWLILL